ncbi:protein MNN4-like [Cucumis melo var. makuwa]|uniref:Protein MNN4-like n=1 Tax=Cucumis melo var. makuwa TaxID=1194695 RepID=A0A5D3C162_CUCMM|nr:protein MNN4-like [Cucumis melo var. makuwa]
MSGEQSLIEALKKYQATLGKARLLNEAFENSPADDPMLEQKGEIQLKEVVISGIQKKTKKVKSGLLKIKVKVQGAKALVEEKKKQRRGIEELFGEVEKVAQSMEKGKCKKMTFKGHNDEFEKEIETLSPLKEEAPRQKKMRKVTM